MVSRRLALKTRMAHRYLGLFLGIQFLGWTLSGLYFSWTNIDQIHGDHFRKTAPSRTKFINLGGRDFTALGPIHKMELRDIAGEPYYWVNDSILVHAKSGVTRPGVTEDEALAIAYAHMKPELKVSGITRISTVGPHHEYREKPLPAFVISYEGPEQLKVYVSERDGKFQTVRYQSWRWFDFLWMTHTMDYQGRDNFNTLLLRLFSLMGVITVLSGLVLWMVSSKRIHEIFGRSTA